MIFSQAWARTPKRVPFMGKGLKFYHARKASLARYAAGWARVLDMWAAFQCELQADIDAHS